MIPLRLVLDTDVVISAAPKPNDLERTAFILAITKPARLYISQAILEEYRDVHGHAELKIRKGARRQLLQLTRNRSYTVKPSRRIDVTGDADDNKFLECADAARADYLMTGNRRHFPRHWKKTKVITARALVELVTPHLMVRGVLRLRGLKPINLTALNFP